MDTATADARSTKSAINSIILDYLVTSGFAGAAEKFVQESDLAKTQSIDIERIRARVDIRNLIFTGQLQSAVEGINAYDPEFHAPRISPFEVLMNSTHTSVLSMNSYSHFTVCSILMTKADHIKILDKNSNLHFRLLQLQLIEIIRAVLNKSGDNPSASDFRPALEFATQQLSPHAPRDPKHLDALEKTMALTIFRSDKMIPEIKALLDERLRESIAEEVNQALLTADGLEPEARIKEFVRARAWAEARAREANVELPSGISIGLDVGDNDQTMVT